MESKVSPEELKERQLWTLDQKIDHSLGTIEQWMSYCDEKAYVSFSEGKDSLVLLHLVRRLYPKCKAVFFNTTNEFPEIYKFLRTIDNLERVEPEMNLKAVIEKVGFPLVSKEQSQYIREAKYTKSEKLLNLRMNGREGKPYQGKISKKWQHLVYAPFDVSEKCCYHLKKKPAMAFEKRTGMTPILGTMAEESKLRKQKYYKTGCNSFETKRKASYPLSIWTTDDVWAYIHRFNLDYCDIYDKGETQTGCMVCGFGCHRDDRFARLAKNHPKAFNIAMNYTNNGVRYEDAIALMLNRDEKGFGVLDLK